jgi:lysophospholipase L1-like esterase
MAGARSAADLYSNMLTRRRLLASGALATAAITAAPALGETWEERWNRRLKEDWAGWKNYVADNQQIIKSGQPVDIVFMGDSITEGWLSKMPDFFTAGRICRGTSGETTPQMVLRMIPDVCDLKPRVVHIMAGTNDIAGNTGAAGMKNVQDCYKAMHLLAKAHGISVIFGSIPPAAAFPWRPGLDTITPIRELSEWLRSYARDVGATFVDYTPALSDGKGAMKAGLAYDGVHPTVAGYEVMAGVLGPVLAKHPALKISKSRKVKL